MDYKDKRLLAIKETLEAYVDYENDRPWIVSYSGGKDSTVALDIVISSLLQLREYNPSLLKREIHITTAQTHLDFVTDPLKQSELKKIQTVIDHYKLPMKIIEVSAPIEKSFVYLVLGRGYPLPGAKMNRWCTERLKIEPSKKAHKEINPVWNVMGVRLSESASRRESIESRQVSRYFTENAFYPIVDFTLDDVWNDLVKEKTAWGDAEELSQLYKEATGECGLRQRKAGGDEKNDDPCGARTGCIICPVVKIDKSSKEFAKHNPWLQPYVDLRNEMIDMYNDPRNKAGEMRNGTVLEYGQGTFTIKARMKLYEMFIEAQELNKTLAHFHGVEPQKIIYSDELDNLIKEQWKYDLENHPGLEDAMEIGLFYETKIRVKKKDKNDPDTFQIVWNHLDDQDGEG